MQGCATGCSHGRQAVSSRPSQQTGVLRWAVPLEAPASRCRALRAHCTDGGVQASCSAWRALLPAVALSICTQLTVLPTPGVQATEQRPSYVRIERRNVENMLVKQFKSSLSELSDEELGQLFEDVLLQRQTSAGQMMSAVGIPSAPALSASTTPAAAPVQTAASNASNKDSTSKSSLWASSPSARDTADSTASRSISTNQEQPPLSNKSSARASQANPSQLTDAVVPVVPEPEAPSLKDMFPQWPGWNSNEGLQETAGTPASATDQPASEPSNSKPSWFSKPGLQQDNSYGDQEPAATAQQNDVPAKQAAAVSALPSSVAGEEEAVDPTLALLEQLRQIADRSSSSSSTENDTTTSSASNQLQDSEEQGSWLPNPLSALPKLPSLPQLPQLPSLPDVSGAGEAVGGAVAAASQLVSLPALDDLLPEFDSRTQAAVAIVGVAGVVLAVAALTAEEKAAAPETAVQPTAGSSSVGSVSATGPSDSQSNTSTATDMASKASNSGGSNGSSSNASELNGASAAATNSGTDSSSSSTAAAAVAAVAQEQPAEERRSNSPIFRRGAVSMQKLLDNGPDLNDLAFSGSEATADSVVPAPSQGAILWQRQPAAASQQPAETGRVPQAGRWPTPPPLIQQQQYRATPSPQAAGSAWSGQTPSTAASMSQSSALPSVSAFQTPADPWTSAASNGTKPSSGSMDASSSSSSSVWQQATGSEQRQAVSTVPPPSPWDS